MAKLNPRSHKLGIHEKNSRPHPWRRFRWFICGAQYRSALGRETRRGVTPPVSWHLRSEEQKAIADAWNTISNGAQIAVVLERLPSKDVDDEEEDY